MCRYFRPDLLNRKYYLIFSVMKQYGSIQILYRNYSSSDFFVIIHLNVLLHELSQSGRNTKNNSHEISSFLRKHSVSGLNLKCVKTTEIKVVSR